MLSLYCVIVNCSSYKFLHLLEIFLNTVCNNSKTVSSTLYPHKPQRSLQYFIFILGPQSNGTVIVNFIYFILDSLHLNFIQCFYICSCIIFLWFSFLYSAFLFPIYTMISISSFKSFLLKCVIKVQIM